MRSDAIIKILKDLKTRLSGLGSDFFNEIAPSDADYPYIVYDVYNSNLDGGATEIVLLDIDGWDDFARTGSTLELEELMAQVAAALQQKLTHPEAGISFRYILSNRMSLQDDDKQIRRRKYTFDVRVIGKE